MSAITPLSTYSYKNKIYIHTAPAYAASVFALFVIASNYEQPKCQLKGNEIIV